jgi:hypothetical protein
MRAEEGTEVDHISGDKLDNRRTNLRFATRSMQAQNAHTPKGRYRNVYLDKRDGVYYGQIRIGKERFHTGRDPDREVIRLRVEELRRKLLPHARRYWG